MAFRHTDATLARAQAKRDNLLRAARKVVAAEGFAGAKVTAVARVSGVSAGSLYTHFDNRDALLTEVFREVATRELEAVRSATDSAEADPQAQLDALIATFVSRALRNRRLAWALLFEPVSPLVEAERLVYRRAYIELGERIITTGIDRGVFASQDSTIAAAAMMGAISEALGGRLNPAGLDALGQLSDSLVISEIHDFCFRALGATQATTTEEGQP